MAGITAALYALQAVAALITGWLSDMAIARGQSPTLVRKGFVIGGMAGTGLLFAGAAVTGGIASTLMLVASGFTVGISGTMVFTIGQTLAGPRAGGRWMGFQNMLGNLSGIAAPIITGVAVDWSGSFAAAFYIAAALSALGVVCWAVVVGDIRAVEWGRSMRVRAHQPAVLAA
jgi:MFS family permease